MRATLEFSLPDERAEYEDAVNGWRYKVAIQDYLNHIRRLDKDGTQTIEVRMAGDVMFRLCEENGFDPWDDTP